MQCASQIPTEGVFSLNVKHCFPHVSYVSWMAGCLPRSLIRLNKPCASINFFPSKERKTTLFVYYILRM